MHTKYVLGFSLITAQLSAHNNQLYTHETTGIQF